MCGSPSTPTFVKGGVHELACASSGFHCSDHAVKGSSGFTLRPTIPTVVVSRTHNVRSYQHDSLSGIVLILVIVVETAAACARGFVSCFPEP